MPDVTLAKGAAGLRIGEHGGIECDSRLRASAEGVFAAGDVLRLRQRGPRPHARVEHWDHAIETGKTVGRNINGADVPHEAVPYFFSDLADWTGLEYVGPASSWDQEEGGHPCSMADGDFSHWYLQDGRLVAALAVGRSEDLDTARRLIASHDPVEAAKLADESADLTSL